MKSTIFFVFLALMGVLNATAQDAFSGKYSLENQAEYVADKKWIEIARNEYQEIVVNSDSYSGLVAYYDEPNSTLFYVIEKHAQYNSLMKIKVISNRKIELYILEDNRWQKYPYPFIKE